MSISLRRLIVDCKKYNLELLAGENGLNNQVRWVHIVEDKDVPNFLHGFELVFTTGIGIKNNDEFDFIAFADSLIEHKASGWIINEGPHINKIPRNLIDYCNEKDFPLFTIPWKERLIDVTYDITHTIISNEEKKASISESFSNIIFHSGDTKRNVEILEREGYKASDKYQIVYIDPMLDPNQDVLDLSQIESKIYSLAGYSIFNENEKIVVVISEPSHDDIEYIVDQIKINSNLDESRFKVGISKAYEGLLDLDKIYKEAKIACTYAKEKKLSQVEYKDIGMHQIIGQIDDKCVLEGYIQDCIGEIKKYDKKNDTNYLEIIKLYIKYDGSIIEMADSLGVHRNTINYKIKFIKSYFKMNMTIEELTKLNLAIIMDEMKRR